MGPGVSKRRAAACLSKTYAGVTAAAIDRSNRRAASLPAAPRGDRATGRAGLASTPADVRRLLAEELRLMSTWLGLSEVVGSNAGSR